MAERLTEKKNDKYVIDGFKTDFAVGLRKNCLHSLYGEPVNKLGKLEDILEKYGIESVEELDFRLAFKQNDVFNYKEITKLETDRDTWQKACELACRHIAEVEWLSCPETDDIKESENEIKTLTKQSLNYFYQQAKKKGNDE